MDVSDLLQLLEDVGREMVRLEMREHVEIARQTYAALRAGRTPTWSEESIVEWARVLRVPPHHEHYRVYPRTVECPRLSSAGPHVRFEMIEFPGGHRCKCVCGEMWLALD